MNMIDNESMQSLSRENEFTLVGDETPRVYATEFNEDCGKLTKLYYGRENTEGYVRHLKREFNFFFQNKEKKSDANQIDFYSVHIPNQLHSVAFSKFQKYQENSKNQMFENGKKLKKR